MLTVSFVALLIFLLLPLHEAFQQQDGSLASSPHAKAVYKKFTELGITSSLQKEEYDPLEAREVLLLALASYCTVPNLVAWDCWWCNQTVFRPRNLRVVTNTTWNSQCWLGIYQDTIILAFRGTQSTSITNWFQNLKFGQVPLWNDTADVLVHHGFLDTYLSLKEGILNVMPDLIKLCPNCSTFFTGHSLGAAMATIAAVDLQRIYGFTDIRSYTFGSPRVGNPDFALLHRKLVGTNYRLVNRRDVVPRIPGHIFEISGYAFWHVSTEIWYLPDGPTEFQTCDGSGEDPMCSNSVNFLWCSVWDHGTYLGLNTTDGHMHYC